MKKQNKQVGALLLLGGIALIVLSMKMSGEVAEGEQRVAQAEQEHKNVRILRPVRAEIARESNASLQQKIQQGVEDLTNKQGIAGWCQIGGVVLVLLGLGSYFKKKS